MNTETIIWNLEQVVKLLKEQNMLLKRVFNSRDAALYLGISRDTLYHLTGKNLVPCYKMNGHRLYFSHEELERWLLSVKKGKKGEGQGQEDEGGKGGGRGEGRGRGEGEGRGEGKSQEPAPAFGLN